MRSNTIAPTSDSSRPGLPPLVAGVRREVPRTCDDRAARSSARGSQEQAVRRTSSRIDDRPAARQAAMKGRSFTAVFLSGLLTGSELTSWGVVYPTLWKLDHAEQVRAEKLMYRRFASVDPFLQTGALAACLVAAARLRGRDAALALAAGSSYAAMLAITLAGNMPINLRVFSWDDEHGDSQEWQRLRRRWDRLHTARIVLDTAGFALITLATIDE